MNQILSPIQRPWSYTTLQRFAAGPSGMVPKGIKGKAFETVRKINGGNHKLMRQHLEYVDKANKVRRWRHPDLLNTTVARRKTTARFPDGLVKSYMDLGKSTTLAPPLERFTVFLKEDVSKASVLEHLLRDAELSKLRSLHVKDTLNYAAVVLVSPAFATWLNDPSFTASFVATFNSRFNYRRDKAIDPDSVTILAAVVEGLCPTAPFRELRQGFSIQCGELAKLLPGLWENQHKQEPDRGRDMRSPDAESFLSISLNNPAKTTLAVPLANTIFRNGKRSTLLASKWWPAAPHSLTPFTLLTDADVQAQTVVLPRTHDTLSVRLPLLPITAPRKITESLGNIIRAVDIGDTPMPASAELEINIPLLLRARENRQARRSSSQGLPLPDGASRSGPIGVWALIIPGKEFQDQLANNFTRPNLHRGLSLEHQMSYLHTKLAFESEMEAGNMDWELNSIFTHALKRGSHFHKILSGGGGWGSKAGLLSLDPQTSYGASAGDQDMEAFIRSFNKEDGDTSQSIVKPGDWVQFFVENDPPAVSGPEQQDLLPSRTWQSLQFGVGDASIKDTEQGNGPPIEVVPHHFGAYSAQGIYVSSDKKGARGAVDTKLDIPSSFILEVRAGDAPTSPSENVIWRKKTRTAEIEAIRELPWEPAGDERR